MTLNLSNQLKLLHPYCPFPFFFKYGVHSKDTSTLKYQLE